jgi:hypothetical protein
MLSKILGRAGLLLVVIGVVVGLGFYHHARGARFVVRLAPASAPPAPSDCPASSPRHGASTRGFVARSRTLDTGAGTSSVTLRHSTPRVTRCTGDHCRRGAGLPDRSRRSGRPTHGWRT